MANEPKAAYPGITAFDQRGVELAFDMVTFLEDPDTLDSEGVLAQDRSCLENWTRQGEPFRNIVAEFLTRARNAGSDVEESFCAMLSDFMAVTCAGASADSFRWGEMFAPYFELDRERTHG